MADRRSLGIVGFVFGGVTVAVLLVAALVVKQHMDRMAIEDQHLPVIAASAQTVIR